FAQTTAESNAGVTPMHPEYPPGDVRRYGADPTGGGDSTAALNSAFKLVAQTVTFPAGTFNVNSNLDAPVCGQIIGSEQYDTNIVCGPGVDRFLSLGTRSVFNLKLIRNIRITGNKKKNACGLIVGDGQLYNILSVENVWVTGFTGDRAVGIYVKDAVGI